MTRTMRYPLSLVCLSVLFAAPLSAAARGPVSSPNAYASGDMFVGTAAELVATAMPELLARVDIDVAPASSAVVSALEAAFDGSPAFVWDATFVKVNGAGSGYSVTLPARVDVMRQGVLVLGLVDHGRLSRAFQVQVVAGQDAVQFRFWSPDGTPVASVDLGLDGDGSLQLAPAGLLQLVSLFYPAAAKGAFDSIIQMLQGVLDMLYEVMNIVNMAICAVNEAIEMMNEMNACPLYDINLGTGDLANAIICLVQGVIAFVGEVQGCF